MAAAAAASLSSVVSRFQMLYTSDHASVVSLNLFVALLCTCIVLGHLLEENRWMNESITALLIVSFSYRIFYYLNFLHIILLWSDHILFGFMKTQLDPCDILLSRSALSCCRDCVQV